MELLNNAQVLYSDVELSVTFHKSGVGMYRDRPLQRIRNVQGQTITKDQECTLTDNFTWKECTGKDRPLQRIRNVNEVNFNLVTDEQTDRQTDTVTFALLELLLRS